MNPRIVRTKKGQPTVEQYGENRMDSLLEASKALEQSKIAKETQTTKRPRSEETNWTRFSIRNNQGSVKITETRFSKRSETMPWEAVTISENVKLPANGLLVPQATRNKTENPSQPGNSSHFFVQLRNIPNTSPNKPSALSVAGKKRPV